MLLLGLFPPGVSIVQIILLSTFIGLYSASLHKNMSYGNFQIRFISNQQFPTHWLGSTHLDPGYQWHIALFVSALSAISVFHLNGTDARFPSAAQCHASSTWFHMDVVISTLSNRSWILWLLAGQWVLDRRWSWRSAFERRWQCWRRQACACRRWDCKGWETELVRPVSCVWRGVFWLL